MDDALIAAHPLLIGFILGMLALAVLLLLAWVVRRGERAADASGVEVSGGGLHFPHRADVRALTHSFTVTLKGLRAMVPGAGWRYAAPWVLLLGSAGSGKSALASSIGLHRPFDLDTDPDLAEHGCAWHVFERGIVLDPAGSILWGDEEHGKAGDGGWRRLLQLLLRHRAERGLDGVVVTLPCSDLIGPDRLDANGLAHRAKLLRRRLREVQQQLGLRLPVYLVVTKCDVVPGFASFWEPLAAQRANEVFGWSNGQTLETVYDPNRVNEAFDEIGRELHRALMATAVATGGISDMAFLFPAEFQKLAAPLARFADRLFRADAYQDPHFFRGLYFTGDGAALGAGGRGLPVPVPGGDDGDDLPAGMMPGVAPLGVQPLFVTDLFGEKIFREARLVQPARRGLVARSRAVRNAQIALVAVALILVGGLWYSYRALDVAKANLSRPMQVVEDAEQTMQRARAAGETLSAYKKLRDVAPKILDAFKTVSDRELLVPFIPSSWFSNIEEDVKGGLVHGFRLVVLDPMRLELINRWKDVQARYAGPLPAGAGEVAAFARMKGYLDEIDRIAGDLTLYSNAKQLPVQTFAGLTTSLLGIDLGEALRTDNALYAEVMGKVTVKPLDIEQNLAPSRGTLKRLVGDAALLIAPDGPLARPFGALANALERVELARFGTPEGSGAALQDLSAAMQRVQGLLGDPNLRWLFVKHPELEAHWQGVLPRIRRNPFLGEQAAAETLGVATARVEELRNVLLAIRVPGLGPILAEDESADGLLRLTPALADLAGALPDILRYEFMADAPVRQPVLPAQRSNAMMWLPEPLDKAVRHYRAFEQMEAGPLARVPDTLRPMVQALAAQRLQGAMLTAVAEAQVVEKRGQDFRLTADETALLREVREFGRASRGLADVLAAFSRRGFDQAYGSVGEIVAQHLVTMLDQADRIAEEGSPYLPFNEFRDWDGTLPMNADGWQALSDVELAQYLDNTRGRFDWLGMEVAGPIVNFALREQTPPALRNDQRVTKWQRILIEQQRYKADNPNSSLALLERYVRFDLGEAVKPDNCLQQLAGGSYGSGGDYFLQRRDTLRRMALAQCQRVAARSMSTDYARLASDFNSLLAGRYPFGEHQGPDTPEADIDAVTAFLERFGAAEPAIRRGLGAPAPGTPAAQALEFMNRMGAVRDFLAPFLAANSAAPPAFDVTPEFRVNRPRETGGNQIIDWTVTLGEQTLQRGGEAKAAKWSPGVPVAVTLRWAKDAPVVPVSIIGGDGSVQPDRAISFAYANRWSLLRLIQTHRAPPSDLPKLTDPQPHTLKFSADTAAVPVQGQAAGQPGAPAPKPPADGKTAVYLRLALSTPNPDGKTKTSYALPVFPYAAPRLDAGRSVRAAVDEDPLDLVEPVRLVPRKPAVKRVGR